MIRLILTNQVLVANSKPEKVLTVRIDQLNVDQDEINSCMEEDMKNHYMNILLPESKYNEILNSRGKDFQINLNIMTYPDNFIVPKESVRAVSKLSNTQIEMMWHFLFGKTLEEIADKSCKALNTIKRHSQDIRCLLDLKNRCQMMVTFIRHLLEHEPCRPHHLPHKPHPASRKPQAELRTQQQSSLMKSLNNKVSVNGILYGTGWLPPVPDLRDYSEEHSAIRDVLGMRKRGGEKEKGRMGDRKPQAELHTPQQSNPMKYLNNKMRD